MSELPFWEVDFLEHDGALIATGRPENLHFIKQLGVLGPHEGEFELSLGAVDAEGDPIVPKLHSGNEPRVNAYMTDIALRRSDMSRPLVTGMLTSYGGVEAGEEHVRLAFKSYLHYLERRCWPYDATLSYQNWPDGFRFQVRDAEVGQIVKDVLETVRDLSPNWPDPPSAGFPSFSLDFTVDIDDTGKTINYEISAFESQSIYELVRTLAEQAKLQGGFDFYMSQEKVFRLVYPEVGDPTNPIDFIEVDASDHVKALSIAFTDTGPESTHVLGIGAGTATRQGGINRHRRVNSSWFRRLDKVADYGDVKNLDMLIDLTESDLHVGANARSGHEIPISVDPRDFSRFWTRFTPGVYVFVDYDLGYHRVHSVQRVMSMDCTVDLEGNETVALGLKQYVDTSAVGGLADP